MIYQCIWNLRYLELHGDGLPEGYHISFFHIFIADETHRSSIVHNNFEVSPVSIFEEILLQKPTIKGKIEFTMVISDTPLDVFHFR